MRMNIKCVKNKRIRFEDFLHGFGSRLGIKGVDLKVILDIMVIRRTQEL